jgi:hypothetical protein
MEEKMRLNRIILVNIPKWVYIHVTPQTLHYTLGYYNTSLEYYITTFLVLFHDRIRALSNEHSLNTGSRSAPVSPQVTRVAEPAAPLGDPPVLRP